MNLQERYARSNDPNLYRRGPNPNLVGMNTQFRNANLFDNNKNLFNSETYKKYDVIQNPGLEYKLINKPYKLVLYGAVNNGEVSFTLNDNFNDVVSIKLLKGFCKGTNAAFGNVEFLVLHIDELRKNYSDNGDHKLINSFAVLDLDKVADNGTENHYYQNTYSNNEDIMYFDPPLNNLNKLTCKIFRDDDTTLDNSTDAELRLEFMIETKEKLRVY